jgi:hypothetical protein
MKNYGDVIAAEPRWTNPTLVKDYYSPGVAQTVAEMNSENAKRVEALKHPGRNPVIQ